MLKDKQVEEKYGEIIVPESHCFQHTAESKWTGSKLT
jgi:hypothetical protein